MTSRSPFGSDFVTFRPGQEPDIDPTFTPVEGEPAIVQAVLRSWADYLRELAHVRMSATARERGKRRLIALAESDERVARAEVQVEIGGIGLRITGRIHPRIGKPFNLVVGASELTVRLDKHSPVTS